MSEVAECVRTEIDKQERELKEDGIVCLTCQRGK